MQRPMVSWSVLDHERHPKLAYRQSSTPAGR